MKCKNCQISFKIDEKNKHHKKGYCKGQCEFICEEYEVFPMMNGKRQNIKQLTALEKEIMYSMCDCDRHGDTHFEGCSWLEFYFRLEDYNHGLKKNDKRSSR